MVHWEKRDFVLNHHDISTDHIMGRSSISLDENKRLDMTYASQANQDSSVQGLLVEIEVLPKKMLNVTELISLTRLGDFTSQNKRKAGLAAVSSLYLG